MKVRDNSFKIIRREGQQQLILRIKNLFLGKWSTMFRTEIAAGRSASTILTVLPLKLPANEIKASVSFQVRRYGQKQIMDQITKEILIEVRNVYLFIFFNTEAFICTSRRQWTK